MVYITADGKVHKGERPKSYPRMVQEKFSNLDYRLRAILIVAFAVIFRRWLNPNVLANGKIPASDVAPADHWTRIKNDDGFMRRLTEHLGGNRDRKLENEMKMKSGKVEILLDLVDFGGPDGHNAETMGGWNDIESMRGTRCSTTRSAVTAYFCGADVAQNQDLALGASRKPSNPGVQSFADYITCRYNQGESNGGNHKRAVYRLGIGCEDSLAGYSHAFSIIAQPDGSFFWLQSYIGHYSLQSWMEQGDVLGNPHGHLSYDQLIQKLQKVERLMNIWSWTPQANADYFELFWVDKEEKALENGKPPVARTWDPTHRLSSFVWDEACEYPLPSSRLQDELQDDHGDNDNASNSNNNNKPSYSLDECEMELATNIFEEFKLLVQEEAAMKATVS